MDGNVAMTRIEQILQHIRSAVAAPGLAAHARQALICFVQDSLAVGLAGRKVPDAQRLLDSTQRWGTAATMCARVWGTGERLPAASAALVNGYCIHNQEFDCVHERAVVHPMAVILATLLSYADGLSGVGRPVNGQRLLAALSVAVDVATVLGMSTRARIRYFRPAQCGLIGATAGLAVLLQASPTVAKNALGLAYSQLAGTMQAHVEGTPALALQIGLAARAAVTAIDMAEAGLVGPHDILDGEHGYFHLFEAGAAPDSAFAELGVVAQITRVSHKPFPTGRAAQGAIAGLQALQQQYGFSAVDVARVTLAAPPLIRQLVDRPITNCMSVAYARLCLPFLVASTLKYGTVDLDSYAPNRLADPQIQQLANRVQCVDDGNTDLSALRPQRLRVTLESGAEVTHEVPWVLGSPEAPLTPTAHRAKFDACLMHAGLAHRADAIFQAVAMLDTQPDAAAVVLLTLPT
jgi:aconitate decarboxylase